MAVKIQFRNDVAADWTTANPILSIGELGLETDTGLFKVGDGVTAWNSLGYGGIKGDEGGFDATQVIEDKSTSFTIASGDAGKLITNSAAITVTVDDNLSVGEQIDFLQNTTDQITFAAGSGVTLNSKEGRLVTADAYAAASIKCVASGVYVLVGDLA